MVMLYSLLTSVGMSCRQSGELTQYVEVSGQTMGTYYRLSYQGAKAVPQSVIDSVLRDLNLALSTYIPESLISRFNASPKGIDLQDYPSPSLARYLLDNFLISADVHRRSEGYFDPTVFPLVVHWGFGPQGKRQAALRDSVVVDSLRALVGLEKIDLAQDAALLTKSDPRVSVDFSAIAKGYAVDELADMLTGQYEVKNYLIDIGGEVKALGVSAAGIPWRVGISKPDEQSGLEDLALILSLTDRAAATSGNYRNFHDIDGVRVSHTMNPFTGYFERNDILSATVVSQSCAIADAWATAFMSMGFSKARTMVEQQADLESVLMYLDEHGQISYWHSPSLDPHIKKNE